MTSGLLTRLIFLAGLVHFSILIASALVPFRLNWKEDLKSLSQLHRQMYWTYGGYVVMAIIAFGAIGTTCAAEIAQRTPLARGFSLYVFVFWLVRLGLQGVFEVKPHLTTWWLKLGYRVLTALFAFLAIVFGWAAFGPVR